jgi:hypothetical protein
MNKKVLLISYHYPPSAEVGGLRCANFSRHLSRFGWLPYVLTLKDECLDKTDPEKLKDVGAVTVFKAGRMPTVSQAYVGIKRVAQRLARKSSESVTRSDTASGAGKSSGLVAETLLQTLRRYILSFLSLPDEQRNWVWPAVIQGVRIIKREKIDCIFTSSPPYSVNLVGCSRLLRACAGWRISGIHG